MAAYGKNYRGPYTTLSVDKYVSMTNAQQRMYRYRCSIAAALIIGFTHLFLIRALAMTQWAGARN
jgi:hypothetical protein